MSRQPAFTGERFVPGQAGARIRLRTPSLCVCRRFVRGRRVLDLGCGLGYGAEVWRRSPGRWSPSIATGNRSDTRARAAPSARSFVVADAARLPFRDASFEVVIAYELIEHLTDQEGLVSEIRRVLSPAGLLLISSPDKTVYSGKLGQRNPFHPKE